jgi:hypothetical protein
VRELPPAFPLVEDVSLLILTPLIVSAKHNKREQFSYQISSIVISLYIHVLFSKLRYFNEKIGGKAFSQKSLIASDKNVKTSTGSY